MKLSLTGGGVVGLAAVAAVGVGALWLYSKRGAVAQAAGAAVDAVNPASSTNIVNRGVTAAGAAISGDDSWTLGGWLYDVTHRDEVATLLQGSRPAAPPVNASIMDRWDYYARGGQSAASGSGASGGW